MSESSEKFDVIYKEQAVKIEAVSIGGQSLYKILFSDRPAMFVTRAKDFNSSKFWTSVPEGRQELAEEIGELIMNHYKLNT
ncbi:MAG: hypothetical protein NVSMB45_17410 [Ginsengibacter sp.]